jgi:hypothetical protein
MHYSILTPGRFHRISPTPMNAQQEQQYYEESEGRLISTGAVASGVARAMLMTYALHLGGATATFLRSVSHHFYHS